MKEIRATGGNICYNDYFVFSFTFLKLETQSTYSLWWTKHSDLIYVEYKLLAFVHCKKSIDQLDALFIENECFRTFYMAS